MQTYPSCYNCYLLKDNFDYCIFQLQNKMTKDKDDKLIYNKILKEI